MDLTQVRALMIKNVVLHLLRTPKGAAPSDVYPTLEGAPAYAYWLRTIGGTSEGDYAAYVNREGEDYAFGNVVDIRYGVRPMMYISIK